jgi:hypothetical protein
VPASVSDNPEDQVNHAAEKPPLDVSNTSELRDLSQSAARIFGWGEGGMTVHANQALIVTQEQLEQIRQLREPVVNEAPQLEGRRPS